RDVWPAQARVALTRRVGGTRSTPWRPGRHVPIGVLLAGLVILTWSAISAEEGLGAALGSRGSDAVHRGGTAAAAAARRSRSCRPRSRTHRRLPCPRLRRYPTRIPAPPIAIGRDGHVTTAAAL